MSGKGREFEKKHGAGARIISAAAALLMAFGCFGCAGNTVSPAQTSEGPAAGTDPDTSSVESTSAAPDLTTAPAATTEAPAATTAAPEPEKSVLDGKKVIFIGNSMIYYGGVVTKGNYRSTDTGLFYQICRANGDKTTVIDCTYGSHHLYDYADKCKTDGCDVGVGGDLLQGLDLSTFDYVFMSESGNNNSNFVRDVKNVMARFKNPDTVFVYMCHTYSYDKGHTKVTGKLAELQSMGVIIADWGHLCYDLYTGRVKNPTAKLKYVKDTFVNHTSSDSHHPNPLAGYIAAQTCYCAVTGKSAVGQKYDACDNIKYGPGTVSFSAYTDKYYTSGDSNFVQVFMSPDDMAGIQTLIDKYVANWRKN